MRIRQQPVDKSRDVEQCLKSAVQITSIPNVVHASPDWTCALPPKMDLLGGIQSDRRLRQDRPLARIILFLIACTLFSLAPLQILSRGQVEEDVAIGLHMARRLEILQLLVTDLRLHDPRGIAHQLNRQIVRGLRRTAVQGAVEPGRDGIADADRRHFSHRSKFPLLVSVKRIHLRQKRET